MTQIQLKIKLFRIVKDNVTFIDKIQVLVKRKKKTENGRNEGKFFLKNTTAGIENWKEWTLKTNVLKNLLAFLH